MVVAIFMRSPVVAGYNFDLLVASSRKSNLIAVSRCIVSCKKGARWRNSENEELMHPTSVNYRAKLRSNPQKVSELRRFFD